MGTEPPVGTEIMVVALLERAPRPKGRGPWQAPALAFALQPGRDDGTARRCPDACPPRHARGQVHGLRPPAPVVGDARDDLRERLRHGRPPPRLREPVSPAADEVPPRPRRISGHGGCTPGFPAFETSPPSAWATAQREPTTGRMSSPHVTRVHGLKRGVARRHQPRAPSSQTTRGCRAGDLGAPRRR